jgi:hypothetical protein
MDFSALVIGSECRICLFHVGCPYVPSLKGLASLLYTFPALTCGVTSEVASPLTNRARPSSFEGNFVPLS